MASVNKNLAANLIGKIWVVLMSVIFTPVYINLIGVEAYGIVGIYTALTVLFSLLDLGLHPTVSRELARLSSDSKQLQAESHHLIRTLEWVYWPMAVVIGAVIYWLAPFISKEWITAEQLSENTIHQAICCIGLALALQWPSSLYHGALMGLQKQVVCNINGMAIATLKGLGLIYILTYISPTIQAFFIWQICLSILQTFLMYYFLWKLLPKASTPPRFNIETLRRIKKFALGITSTAVLTILLSIVDRVVLSRMLTLEMFSYYALASLVASALTYVSEGLFSAYFPRFTELVAINYPSAVTQDSSLTIAYHTACQLLSVIMIPMALMVSFFSWELIYIWTQSTAIADQVAILISLLVTGTLLTGLVRLPYAMQLAHGWTRLGIYQNAIGLFFLLPLMIAGTYYYGVVAAASVGIIVNAGVICISIPLMHKKILKTEKLAWMTRDVLFPLLATLAVVMLGRYIIPMKDTNIASLLLSMTLVFIAAVLAALCAAPVLRTKLVNKMKKKQHQRV